MKKVLGLEQTYLTIQKCKNDSFKVTGYGSKNCSVTLKAEEMEIINNLVLYEAHYFPGTSLQKVNVTMLVGDPWEQWWDFLTGFGDKFTVRVYCKDFQSAWKEMHE